eukprot:8645623-Pyramimonas_sp.AAC.1
MLMPLVAESAATAGTPAATMPNLLQLGCTHAGKPVAHPAAGPTARSSAHAIQRRHEQRPTTRKTGTPRSPLCTISTQGR